MKNAKIYTDGACSGNPGPGGYGTIVVIDGTEKEYSEGFIETTNNRMELLGVIRGLDMLEEPCDVTVTSDSKYVVDAFEKGWLENWKRKNWRKSDKKPVKNKDLWEQLDALTTKHNVTFNWVKGHDGHEFNERCDTLAVNATASFLK